MDGSVRRERARDAGERVGVEEREDRGGRRHVDEGLARMRTSPRPLPSRNRIGSARGSSGSATKNA